MKNGHFFRFTPALILLKQFKQYSQDNVAMFGLNAGTQCVAMSLASLIYNKRNGIVSSMDLVNIMNIGNELHSGLSSLSRQSYILLTEVPEMIIVFNINYQLQYSSSYTGTIHGTCEVQDFITVCHLLMLCRLCCDKIIIPFFSQSLVLQ